MEYHFSKKIKSSFGDAIEKVTAALKTEGFGIITTIDMKETLKKKLNVDFRDYTILGACNPSFAYQALQADDKTGVLLPCNVTVQAQDNGEIEVSVVNPEDMMKSTDNMELKGFATEVKKSMLKVLDSI
ncbi:MAG: DUF302 domain-containing protein [Chitinophagaceae bacterium]